MFLHLTNAEQKMVVAGLTDLVINFDDVLCVSACEKGSLIIFRIPNREHGRVRETPTEIFMMLSEKERQGQIESSKKPLLMEGK